MGVEVNAAVAAKDTHETGAHAAGRLEFGAGLQHRVTGANPAARRVECCLVEGMGQRTDQPPGGAAR